MKKKISILLSLIMLLSVVSLSGCSSVATTEDFVKSVQSGLEARWKYQDENDETFMNNKETIKNYYSVVDQEYSKVKKYKGKDFEDKEVGKIAEEYIKTLETQLKLCENTDVDYYTWDYNYSALQWYRRNDLKALNDKCKFTFKGTDIDTFQSVLDDEFLNSMNENPKQVEEAFTIVETKVEPEYDWYNVSAKVTNNTDAQYDYYMLHYRVKATDGTVVENEGLASIDNFVGGTTAWTYNMGFDTLTGYTIEVYGYEVSSRGDMVKFKKPIVINIK